MIGTIGAAGAGRARRRRFRSRPAEPGADPEPVEITRVTMVTTEDLGEAEAGARWLQRVGGDADAAQAYVGRAVQLLNAALGSHAATVQDPFVHEVSGDGAIATRLGYGAGEQVADGRWSDARELHAAEPRRRRVETLQPAERVAAVLGGQERVEPSEGLLLRARSDVDAGRLREAAIQLDAAVGALLAELGGGAGRTAESAAELRDRRPELSRLAEAARRGELDPGSGEWIADTLARSERAVRRRRAGA